MFGLATIHAESGGLGKKRTPRHKYGNVVINNYSESKNIAPVVFKHWLHRARYTCRLCHVDIGFSMKAGGTEIKEEDNKNGLYCGACHNGKESFSPEEKKTTGSTAKKNCDLCHSYGKKVKFKNDFYQFTKKLPRARFGDKINWVEAEENGQIKPKDYLEGVSFEEEPLKYSSEVEMKSRVSEIPDIIYSHKKHTAWIGCEVCHPDIFEIEKGGTKYTMQEIFAGKYCGACHGKVAFPNLNCRGCHTKSVY
jgi:c(7)-type cytochrome triheme protein